MCLELIFLKNIINIDLVLPHFKLLAVLTFLDIYKNYISRYNVDLDAYQMLCI